jgi:septum site-determining protein MinC
MACLLLYDRPSFVVLSRTTGSGGHLEKRAIRIKGIRDGLLISLEDDPERGWLEGLGAELAEKKGFLSGGRVAFAVGERAVNRQELEAVQELFARHGMALWAVLSSEAGTKKAARDLGLATRLPGSNTDLEGNHRPPAEPITNELARQPVAAPAGAMELPGGTPGVLIKETIRSGRSIQHDGHVAVIGDVNPGAEIIAGGDVVVWGKLRGLVHAGALGDRSAVICALELIPTQLRIADQIAISPDRRRQPVPEMASIRDGHIVAEPWRREGK